MRTQSKRWNFTPDELSLATYQIQDAERIYEALKADLAILEDSEKDLLAVLKSNFPDDSNVDAETKARTMQEWTDFKAGKRAAIRALAIPSCDYKHSLRVLDCLITGVSYNKVLLSKNIYDGGK